MTTIPNTRAAPPADIYAAITSREGVDAPRGDENASSFGRTLERALRNPTPQPVGKSKAAETNREKSEKGTSETEPASVHGKKPAKVKEQKKEAADEHASEVDAGELEASNETEAETTAPLIELELHSTRVATPVDAPSSGTPQAETISGETAIEETSTKGASVASRKALSTPLESAKAISADTVTPPGQSVEPAAIPTATDETAALKEIVRIPGAEGTEATKGKSIQPQGAAQSQKQGDGENEESSDGVLVRPALASKDGAPRASQGEKKPSAKGSDKQSRPSASVAGNPSAIAPQETNANSPIVAETADAALASDLAAPIESTPPEQTPGLRDTAKVTSSVTPEKVPATELNTASAARPEPLSGNGSPSGTGDAAARGAASVDRVRFVQRVARAFHSAQSGDGQVQLRLSPPELGSLRIELRIEQGALTARLEAETPEARNVLLDSLPALRDRLQEQNIRVERFDVDLMKQGTTGQSQTPHREALDQPWVRQSARPAVNRGTAETTRIESGVNTASQGGLNVVI